MNHLVWIRLAIDGSLLISLIYCGTRLLKGQGGTLRTEKLLELEASLRRVITEAQGAGTVLNQELMKRQRDMERLLFDIESAEQRVGRAINTAEDRKSSLELELKRLDRASVLVSREVPASRPEPQRPADLQRSHRTEQIIEDDPVEERYVAPEPARRVAPETRSPRTQSAAAPRLNIYGEPIPAPAAPQPMPRAAQSPLRTKIEKFAQPKSSDLYEVAERLLVAGADIDEVADQTGLPAEEIRVLQEVALRQSPPLPQRVQSADPRLGVLSPVFREVRTV